ncbi:MAG: O-antigen ligase family protein, partial [Kiloniellales bacterium]
DDAPITSSMRPRSTRMKAYLDSALERPANPGIEERLASMRAALEAWREAPIMGIGIGTYNQAHRDVPNVADTIHNTFLWLLTETGIIGAGLFTGFFVVVSLALLRGARGPPAGDPFLWGMLGVLLVFAGASVGTEILYQRYFWFLLGLALAVPYRPGRDRGATDAAPSGTARQPQAHTGIP